MATFPAAHSSSPAVVKVTNTSATISSVAFDPPARVAIVVGVTSDADTNAGAAPTLTAISGLTWTRVGPALGFSATGDVGVVALFQGVLDNPDTDLGSITVTANVGITASKPKMLVVRVYDETQVDISDPIGAITSGSFATSTSFLGTVMPETSDGGLRGLWLDWNATGVPTTIQPNNDNAEIVDTFHNAGLSTNGQIGRRNRTVAGVAQSLGATLLGTSSDGNWMVYELRSPQPAAGSSVDSTAFATDAFDTGGASVPAGTGSGSWSFTGVATGKRAPKASSSGSFTFVGAASGKRSPKSSGAGTLNYVGSGIGAAPTPPPGSGSGSGSFAFVGSSTGKRVTKATGAGSITVTGSASGTTVRRSTGSGTLDYTGAAIGKRTPKASGNATLAFVGTATGKRSPKAGGSGTFSFAGAGIGNAPTPGISEGSGSGSVAWTGTAVGKRSPKGAAGGSFAFVGTGTGKRAPRASGSGVLSLSSSAVGARQPVALGVGSLSWAGAAVGQQTPPPTNFEGRILAARLSIPTASGSIAATNVAGDLETRTASGRLSILHAKGVLT